MKDWFPRCLITALISFAASLVVFSFAFFILLSVTVKSEKPSDGDQTVDASPEKSVITEVYDPLPDELEPIESMIRFITTGETKYFLNAVDPEQTVGLPNMKTINISDIVNERTLALLRDNLLSMISFEITGIDYELVSSKDISGKECPERELELKVTLESGKEKHEFVINPCIRYRNGKWYLKIPELSVFFQAKQAA